jgi:hypothetical protein
VKKKTGIKKCDVQQKVIKVGGVGGGGSKSYVVGTGRFESGGVGCNETTNIPNSRPRGIAELKRPYSHC